MAQYFEVLSQSEGTVEQNGQFFSANENQQGHQVRYILTDDSHPFQQQQVMLVDGSQPVQQVVIESNQIAYQQAPSQAHFVPSANVNTQPQQIFYMETNSAQSVENIPTVIEQAPAMQQSQPAPQSPQPIVLNHQLGSTNVQNRQPVNPGAQRPVLQIRTNPRPGLVQNRPTAPQSRPGIPQQVVRPPSTSNITQMRPNLVGQIRMRPPGVPPLRQTAQIPQPRTIINPQQKSQVMAMLNRQLIMHHQQQQQQQTVPQAQVQQHSQSPAQAPTVAKQVVKAISEFQPAQNKNNEGQPPQPPQIVKQLLKPSGEYQRQQSLKAEDVDELDDHDPSMNSTPGQMASYKKILEQKQQMGKMGILSRISSQTKIEQVPSSSHSSPAHLAHHQQEISAQSPVSPETPHIPQSPIQTSPRKTKAPPRNRHLNAQPRNSPKAVKGNVLAMPPQQQQQPQQQFARTMNQPRMPLNQQQQQQPNQGQIRQFANQPNQPQMVPQRMPHPQNQHQQQMQQSPQPQNQPVQHFQQQQLQQQQSQINYLITPPTANRPRQQRPLPAYIPCHQIKQIIESTQNAEEYSDSIRMLVLLENGEQRLITFTLPKEACTIQEILEQVNVPFNQDTNIQVTEANTNGINYIVTVGNVSNFACANTEQPEERQERPDSGDQEVPAPAPVPPPPGFGDSPPQGPMVPPTSPPSLPELPKPASPELLKELPKLIPGKLAVCSNCGYTGEDFNRCTRCNRKLPDNVKSIDASIKANGQKNSGIKTPPPPGLNISAMSGLQSKPPPVSKPPSPVKKKTTKPKSIDESVVISSDEEEDEKKSPRSVSEQLLRSLGSSVTISPVTKEPSLNEIKKHTRKSFPEPLKDLSMNLKCRTVRVGSYRFAPHEEVLLNSNYVLIKGPKFDNKDEIVTVTIERGDIVKVLVSFHKALPVIFYYLNVDAAPAITETLNLRIESGVFYDPISDKEDSFKKITLLPEEFGEEQKMFFQQVYGTPPYNIMDELTLKEANDILIKTCPKDNSASTSYTEIKQILLYPPEGQGRLSLNTEDYVCLAVDQFLNDKIIDFYLKYLWEHLPEDLQKKVHIFSTFFYKRLTTKPSNATRKSHPHEIDPKLTPAEKRHARVKNWTKRINLFEKDFIVVPINENAHWFLAIICFPTMTGMETFDGKPYKLEPKPKKTKKTKKEKPIPCDDPLLSDKDEAESEDSDMESDDSDASTASATAASIAATVTAISSIKFKKGEKPPIKQPCILIFDSLAGPSRSRVVATLRDYLTAEYKNKIGNERVYNKDNIKGTVLKVPQQTNFTDCGLYLLQYVEHFFKEPIQDYSLPIKSVKNWFEEIIVTKKREDIANLIKKLIGEYGGDVKALPEISLPTQNGKLIEHPEHTDEEQEPEPEDMFTDIEDSEMTDGATAPFQSEENGEKTDPQSSRSPSRPSVESASDKGDIVTDVVNINLLKPTLSEFPRQTSSKDLNEFPRQSNKDTLSYLKAKRIVRHNKPSEGPELKKTKVDPIFK